MFRDHIPHSLLLFQPWHLIRLAILLFSTWQCKSISLGHQNGRPSFSLSMARQNEAPVKVNYVTDDKQLLSTVNDLSHAESIGLDFEFDRNRFAFGFNLCLVQIFDEKYNCVHIIDPVVNRLDLGILYRDVFEEENIVKCMHASSQDLQLMHMLGCFPKSVFDTQLSALVIDEHNQSIAEDECQCRSLNNVTSVFLGVALDKSMQTSNWLRRPLSEEQITYAARDVIYLPDLMREILTTSSLVGVTEIIAEKNRELDFKRYPITYKSYIRKAVRQQVDFRSFLVWMKLLEIREKYAKKLNKPPHHIACKIFLLELSQLKFTQNTKFFTQLERKKEVHPIMKSPTAKADLKNGIMEMWSIASNILSLDGAFREVDYSNDTYLNYISGPKM